MIRIYDTKERAKLYFDSHTFTFLKEIMPGGFEVIRNGFIKKLSNDVLIFFDVVVKIEMPILLDKITDIQPSVKKDITYSQAKEIEERYYEKM